MIGYAMLGTNDPARAKAFYDAVLGLLGVKAIEGMGSENRTLYGAGPGQPMLGVGRPWDGQPATSGNGTMISFPAATRALVDAVHAKAIALGARDEGAPGVRGPNPNGFYGAYFRDPDGNKLCVYRIGPP